VLPVLAGNWRERRTEPKSAVGILKSRARKGVWVRSPPPAHSTTALARSVPTLREYPTLAKHVAPLTEASARASPDRTPGP